MANVSTDWRARLLAELDRRLDDPTKQALAFFGKTARIAVRQLILSGASDLVTRAIAIPTVAMAYAQLLQSLGIPPQEPSTEFLSVLVDDLIAEVRARRDPSRA